ncbi:DUF6756 family protein [Paenibacillus sp. GCM10028914]|uniref:DUF6756 family protein n=1 Tax=Paenibacillus sp. GCM10028914 TaxID=3273416 RepID=UPI0036084162
MNNLSVRFEIEEVCKKHNIPKYRFCEVSKNQWRSILNNIEDAFLIKTHYTQGLHLGFNRLKEPNFSFGLVNATYKFFEYFDQDETIWFIAEDLHDKMWIYEGESSVIFNQVIPELYHLRDYYLVSKKYKWLFNENHNGICVSGELIIDRMKAFVEDHSQMIVIT